eukprot:g8066.t1
MSSEAEEIRIFVVSASGGSRQEVRISPELTVADFKRELHSINEQVAPEDQRLIYRGRILKDQDKLSSYGVTPDCVFHLVRKQRQSTTPVQSTPPPPATTTSGGGSPLSSLFGGQGSAGGMDGFQEAMMQSILNNPELIQSFMQSNPTFRQLMEQNPELAQALNNPEMIRESLRLVSNPNLMQEHMRNVDRAMSNLESIPGGFNALRQIYENVQEPLMNAATTQTEQGRNSDNPFAALFANTTAPTVTPGANEANRERSLNTNPLPNPWVPPTSTPPAPTGPPVGPGDAMNPDQIMQMMQNPAIQQMTQSLLSSPGMMERLAGSIPGMQDLMNSNPQAREMLSNPDTMRNMMNPENIQAIMQLQQSLQTLQRSGLAPSMTDLTNSSMASLFNGGGGLGSTTTPPVTDPVTTYATQLQQLQDMGFTDREANIRALQATGGNVNAAIDRILQGL